MPAYRFFDNGRSPEDIWESLQRRAGLSAPRPVERRWAVYDSFDWRLHAAGLALVRRGADLSLEPLAGGDPLAVERIEGEPRLAEGLPEGALRDRLAPLLDIRAVMAHIRGLESRCDADLLDERGKVVVRIGRVRLGVEPAGELTFWEVQPLRGFADAADRLIALLEELDLSPREAPLPRLMERLKAPPGFYRAKPSVRLDPAMRTDLALQAVMAALVETARANEGGILADLDTEFLHDFRVAIRRTRSLLSQVKEALPEADEARFKDALRRVGKSTNDLRDLDVYLLHADDYRRMLPESLRPAIEPLFALLTRRRGAALKMVRRNLRSVDYRKIMDAWQAFLETPVPATDMTPTGGRPIGEVARECIAGRYRKIVRKGSRIGPDSPDEDFHALRIDCKKLRYLLEMFGSVLPRKAVKKAVKRVKGLQDVLGRLQDIHVQTHMLHHFADELAAEGQADHRTFLAVGALMGWLTEERIGVRDAFDSRFARFAEARQIRRMARLTHSTEAELRS